MKDVDNVVVSYSSKHGKGVFAARNFKKSEVILTIDDSHVVEDETRLTPEEHAFELDYLEDKIVRMQEPEKYINHSCDPNSFVKTTNGIRTLLAIRNIQQGEEITYDYSINGDNDGTFVCRCGSPICRGTYQGDFFKLPVKLQKHYLPYLDDWFVKRHQDRIKHLKK